MRDRTPRVIVFGGRDFTDYKLLCSKLDKYTAELGTLIVVSGRAPGADKLGEMWADSRGFDVHPFPAEWDKYGKSAGPVRNRAMGKFVSGLVNGFAVGFWNGKSRGTAHMIEVCRSFRILLKIVRY